MQQGLPGRGVVLLLLRYRRLRLQQLLLMAKLNPIQKSVRPQMFQQPHSLLFSTVL